MANTIIERVKDLIDEGNAFSYDNFSEKSSRGYPASLRLEYIAWKTKVESFLGSIFGRSSPTFETFKKGDSVPVMGNGPAKFQEQQATILGALTAAIDIVNFEPQIVDSELTESNPTSNNKVFIVHGHDEQIKNQLEIFLSELSLEPIVLHRKADEGLTVIEKFEKHSDVGYAFILLTPDDIGYPAVEENNPEGERRKESRARQNVIFEFGYFVAKLGRKRVCCLYKEGVALPSDISGVIYKKIHSTVEEVAFSILKDLKASGYMVPF